MRLLRSALLLASAAASLSAHAGIYLFNGSLTASSPTFNRPFQNGGSAPVGLSAVGTNVFYSQLLFHVDVAGTYSFTNSSAFDDFAVLYKGALNPSSPLTNALIADDDSAGFTHARLTYDLAAGTTYGFVFTTYSNGTIGDFTTTIAGPGSILPGVASAVPGPMAALPFALMALRRRKRA